MVFTKFVQIGRLVLLNYGSDDGKVAVIVDVIDHNRVLVDGPTTGVPRQAVNFKRLSLLDFTINIGHGSRTGVIKKKLEKTKILDKWNATTWAKKRAIQKKRATLSDFDRFKVSVLKKQRRTIVNTEVNKLTKAANKK